MQDRIGTVVPSPEEIAKAVAALKDLRTSLGPYLIALSMEERKRAVRFRPGGDEIVARVGKLAQDHGAALPKVTVAGMQADLAVARALVPLEQELQSLAQMVADTITEAESECWWAATAFYTALARMTGGDAQLERDLAPVVDFFATGRRRQKTA